MQTARRKNKEKVTLITFTINISIEYTFYIC